jgi:hypothetical protein
MRAGLADGRDTLAALEEEDRGAANVGALQLAFGPGLSASWPASTRSVVLDVGVAFIVPIPYK